ECSGGLFCLRAWPVGMATDALTHLHRLMAQARGCGLDFIPVIHPADHGVTWTEHGGRLWELTSWMPGIADFSANPSQQRLRAAWPGGPGPHMPGSPPAKNQGVGPAVQRRFARFREWSDFIASGWRGPLQGPADEMVYPFAYRAWVSLARHAQCIPALLQPWM